MQPPDGTTHDHADRDLSAPSPSPRSPDPDHEPSRKDDRAHRLSPNLQSVLTGFERALGTRVSLKPGKDNAGGQLTIHYGSDEELDALYRRLVAEDEW